MAGNHPFAINSLKNVSIRTKNGNSFTVHPWNYPSVNPLISLTIDESMFNPLISGTMIVRDIGDWSNEINLKAFDEIDVTLNLRSNPESLGGSQSGSVISASTLSFEITNVKETVNLANQAFQNASETTKAVTLNFVSKNVLSKEFLSSILEDENFIGPIIGDQQITFQSTSTDTQTTTPTPPTTPPDSSSNDDPAPPQSPSNNDSTQTSSVTNFTATMKGFDSYIREKLQLNLDSEKTLNFCYLKRNNVSYPWGKLKGQPTILQTLQYLAENAVSMDNDRVVNYLFWQDFYGFHFRSINSLIQENSNSFTPVYDFNDNNLYPTSIISFETITEFDGLNLLNSDAYFSWYERIVPDFDDPYIDFIDSTDALKTSIVSYDIREEYGDVEHIEGSSPVSEDIDSEIDDNYDKFSENQRRDDQIYGFYSQNRYNTPFPQSWDYLGISCDSRLTNVVWQNQYDIDNQVNPAIIYLYEKQIKKKQHENRKKYVDLKNAKKKWEVYRCALCCTNQIGGTADQKIIGLSGADSSSSDYVYYFGPTGIFKDLSTEQYGVAAAGGFSDVVNYIKGLTGPGGTLTNGLTLSYNLNEAPYNETIEKFYYLKKNLTAITSQISSGIQAYNNELNEINLYIPRITSLLSEIPSWISGATDLAYNNLTPNFFQTCNYFEERNEPDPSDPPIPTYTLEEYGPGSGQCSCQPIIGLAANAEATNTRTNIPEILDFLTFVGEGYGAVPLGANPSYKRSGFYYKNSGPNFYSGGSDCWNSWEDGNDFGDFNRVQFDFGYHEQQCPGDGSPDFTSGFQPQAFDIPKAPLYVNLTYHTADVMIRTGTQFSGYHDLLVNLYGGQAGGNNVCSRYPNYSKSLPGSLYAYASSLRKLFELFIQQNPAAQQAGIKIPPQLSPEAWQLPFIKPSFLYNCTKSKLILGDYYRTTEGLPTSNVLDYTGTGNYTNLFWIRANNLGSFTSTSSNYFDSNKTLSDVIDDGVVWCATCLDPVQLKIVEQEYQKVLKQLKLRKYVLEFLILKLSTLQQKIETVYNEYMDRKAFFISKNPFDIETPGNILNKKSQVSLTSNIKSIKRKPIRGSKYEILAKRIGITSGVGEYVHNIFFNNDSTRNIGLTGNHPYYDQKYRGFSGQAPLYSETYATREAFALDSYRNNDIIYYDNYYRDLWMAPVGTREVGLYYSPYNSNPSSYRPPAINGYAFFPAIVKIRNNLGYPTEWIRSSSLDDLYINETPRSIVNQQSRIFETALDKKPPSIKKEEIDSFVRVEFTEPIGLDRLADFPTGFVRDAGSEYFLPYIVQLTAGPHGRQSIQSNVAVIGMDPYGFDVAVKKIKSKNTYNDYKEWGYYWWHQPVNKLRIQNKTKDISDMHLWAEKSFENEYTFYQNAGTLFYDVGSDFTEYHDFAGAMLPVIYTDYTSTNAKTGSFWTYSIAGSDNTDYVSPTAAITPLRSFYALPVKEIDYGSRLSGSYNKDFIKNSSILLEKQAFDRTLARNKYGSYNLLSSHSHTNIRRSWYDFEFPSKIYFSTVLQNFGNINNLVPGFKPATILTGFDYVNFSGDGLNTTMGGLALKSNQQLISFLNSIEMDSLIHDNGDIPGDDVLSPLASDSFNKLNSQIQQIFSDDIEHFLNADFMLYKPGLLTRDIWKYDIFGETEYGITKPPTLPPEYDSFDNNFSAQFVVFSKTESANICKELNIKCINPNGYVDLSSCPEDDPYCNCGGKSVIPKVREPSYKELAIAFDKTKECKLIEEVFGKEFLGCIISDDKNIISCGCPEQGKHFTKLLAALRTSSTFYNTPPETPLRRNAQMMMINSQRAMMAIYPNDQLRVGSMVEIRKENPTFSHRNRQQRISGKWMITGISRQFKSNNMEMMVVMLARDSYLGSDGNSPTTPGRDIF